MVKHSCIHKEMKVTAKFIGEDGSLGYVREREYILEFETLVNGIRIYDTIGKGMVCRYDSLKAFLNNWSVLK